MWSYTPSTCPKPRTQVSGVRNIQRRQLNREQGTRISYRCAQVPR